MFFRSSNQLRAPASRDDFRIAVICGLPEERYTVEALLERNYRDENLVYGKMQGDPNVYTMGQLGGKPVVVVCCKDIGTTNSRHLAAFMRFSFPNIQYAFVVGITAGAPFVHDGRGWADSGIRLGDVIISTHVMDYNLQKTLSPAPKAISNLIFTIRSGRNETFRKILETTNSDFAAYPKIRQYGAYYRSPGPGADNVFDRGYRHKHRAPTRCKVCSQCTEWHHRVCETALEADCKTLGCVPCRTHERRQTRIHFGKFASGNSVMRSGHFRDKLVKDGVIGFEMEGSGVWEVFGTIIVKGVSDYADGHKNKQWRGYPAVRAALCAKALISAI